MAIGDFFGIQNPGELSPKRLNDLIQEVRIKKTEQKNKPAERHRLTQEAARDDDKINADQRRLDRIQNREERVKQSNRIALKSSRLEAFRERSLDIVEESIEDARKTHQERKKVQLENRREKQRQVKEDFSAAFEKGAEVRDLKKNRVSNARDKTVINEDIANNFFKQNKIKKKEFRENARKQSKLVEERENFRKQTTKEIKDLKSDRLKGPVENRDRIVGEKENRVNNAQLRSQETLRIGGDPVEKLRERNKIQNIRTDKFQAHQKDQRKGYAELFEKNTNIQKDQAEGSVEIGDVHHEIKDGITKKARRIADARITGIRDRRFRNLFPEAKLDPRDLSVSTAELYKRLVEHIKAGDPTRNLNIKKHAAEEYVKRAEMEEEDRKESQQRKEIRLENITDKDIIQEIPNSSVVFEKYIEDIIREKNSVDIDASNPLLEKLEEENNSRLLNKDSRVDPADFQREEKDIRAQDNELETEEEGSIRDSEVILPTPPFYSDDKEIDSIITFIDDTLARDEEKARAVEFELELIREKEAKQENEALEKTENRKKEKLETKLEINKKFLEAYYRKIVEDQNKTAHEKAVDIGHFINLFF